MGRICARGFKQVLLAAVLFLPGILSLPAGTGAQTPASRYWMGGDGNWDSANWSLTYGGAEVTTRPAGGEAARVWRNDATGSGQTIIYNGTYYQADPGLRLNSLHIRNDAAPGAGEAAVPWISVAQQGGVLNVGTPGGAGLTVGPRGAYHVNSGALAVAGDTFVGSNGRAAFTMGQPLYDPLAMGWSYPSPGPGNPISHSTGNLFVNGGNGGVPGSAYNLYTGTLTVDSHVYVGHGGGQAGSFSQGGRKQEWSGSAVIATSDMTDGGMVSIGGHLYVGGKPADAAPASAGNGAYTLSNGTVAVVGHTYVGYDGSGSFVQGQAGNSSGNEATPGGTYRTTDLYLGYTLSGTGSYALSDGALTVDGTAYVGHNGAGSFTQGQMVNDAVPAITPGGTFTTGTLYVGSATGAGTGEYNLANGALNAGNTYVGQSGAGTFTQSGGLHTAGAVAIGPLGTYHLTGGTLTAGTIDNAGSLNYSGGQLDGAFRNRGRMDVAGPGMRALNGPVTNDGQLNVTTTATFRQEVTNNGTLTVNNARVAFEKTVTVNGTLATDPSTLTFAQDLIVGPSGIIRAAAGDIYEVYGSYLNYSSDPNGWDVSGSILKFLGAGPHRFLPGTDRNFAWGTLVLGSAALLELECDAFIYGLSFESGASLASLAYIDSNGYNLYYDPTRPENAFLAYLTYDLTGGGHLAPGPAPVPGALWLLGPGLVGALVLRRRSAKAPASQR